jgi:hypothetical protein
MRKALLRRCREVIRVRAIARLIVLRAIRESGCIRLSSLGILAIEATI